VGFLKRVRRITMAKINAFLDGAENPDEVLPMLLKELREEHQRAIAAEATAVAAQKRRQQEYDEIREDIAKWGGRAELAVRDGDEELARTALEHQLSAEQRLDAGKKSLDTAVDAAERARQARESLGNKAAALEAKRYEILARAQAAEKQESVQKALAGVEADSRASLLEAVSRMEEKALGTEAKATAYNRLAAGMAKADLEDKFRELERKQNIEERLEGLKAKLRGTSPSEE